MTVQLYANGVAVEGQSKTVTENGNWKYTFENLPRYANGKQITYTVQEEDIADYSASYDGMNITNTYTPGQTSETVLKVWDDKDDQDRLRPASVALTLTGMVEGSADAVVTREATVTGTRDESVWTYTFEGLPETVGGKAVTYTVDEKQVPDGYTKSVEGLTVTNKHETAKADDVVVKKVWQDDNNAAQS